MKRLLMWGETERPTKKNTSKELKTLEEYMKDREVEHNGRNKNR